MSPTPEGRRHQQSREQLVNATARAAQSEWRRLDSDDRRTAWSVLLNPIITLVTAGQLASARQTDSYMHRLLPGERAEGAIDPAAFAGHAPDGSSLVRLLALPIEATRAARRKGSSVKEALAKGASLLDALVRTTVADTGRQADRVGMFSRKGVTSYVRVLEGTSCSRCIILAGKEYSVSTGFQRHPRCDCGMEPVTRTHKPTPLLPADVFDSMTPEQRRKIFGEAGSKAIEDGASLSSVVNARKGMTTMEAYGHKIQATHTGTGSRKNPRRGPRLMPEEIYKQADDREHAIRLLRRNGYIH